MKSKHMKKMFVALVVLETLIFGSGNVFTVFAYESITPFWSLAIRFALASAVFGLLFGKKIVRELRQVSVMSWLPAAVCMAVSFIFCNVALDLTSATNVGFLVALPVVFSPLIARMVLHRRYALGFVPFQILVVIGLYLLCSQGGSLVFGLGELLAVGSSIALASALVFGEKSLGELSAVTISGVQMTMAFLLSSVCAVVLEAPINVFEVTPVAWGTIVFLALVSTCLTFALQNLALTQLASSTVSLLLTGEPVFTALFSWVLLGETLTLSGLMGSLLIVGAVIGATWFEGRASSAPTSPDGPLPRSTAARVWGERSFGRAAVAGVAGEAGAPAVFAGRAGAGAVRAAGAGAIGVGAAGLVGAAAGAVGGARAADVADVVAVRVGTFAAADVALAADASGISFASPLLSAPGFGGFGHVGLLDLSAVYALAGESSTSHMSREDSRRSWYERFARRGRSLKRAA